jgi:excisionase family DNA binding protein
MERASGERDGRKSECEEVPLSCREGRPLGVSDQLLLTVTETSQILRLSRSRVYELLYSGVLPSVKIGSSRRVRRADLEWFVNHLEEAS